MPTQAEIREQVTQKIIQALEGNLLPWRRPWRATSGSRSQPGRHSNVASRKPYSGINPILMELHALQHGLSSRWWGIVFQFARDMARINAEVRANGGGTEQVNRHPVCRLYAEQIAWLSGAGSCASHATYIRAHDACQRKVEAEQAQPQ